MTEFTRLTVIGSARKADLVVPNDEALAGLMPRLMDLLDEPTGTVVRPLTLVRSTGEQLDAALTIADQQVSDGELLRLIRSDDAPPPPEVADVTDVLGESLRDRAGLWSTFPRQLTGAIAVGVLSCPSGSAARRRSPTSRHGRGVVRDGCNRRPGVAALDLRGRHCRRAWRGRDGGLAVRLRVQPFAVASALGRDPRLRRAGLDLFRSRFWPGPTFPTGLVRQSGRCPSRDLAADHGGLGLVRRPGGSRDRRPVDCGVRGIAPVGAGGFGADRSGRSGGRGSSASARRGLVDRQRRVPAAELDHLRRCSPDRPDCRLVAGLERSLAVGVGLVVIMVSALRTRAFPLAVQQMALWFAVLAGLLGGLLGQPRLDDLQLAAILAGFIVLVVIMVLARPAAHQRAFLRRIGNAIEALSVIALIPLLLGMFGIFSDLLEAF